MNASSLYLFAGDSITDAGRDRTDPESLGDGYVSLVRDRLAPATVRNAGVAGDRAVDLAARWQRDVVAPRPDTLTVFVGVNDTWRRFDAGITTTATEFAETYRGMLQRVVTASDRPRLILIEPFLLPVREEQTTWLDDLDGKREVVADLADEFDATFVPLHGILRRAAAEVGPAALAPDGVHPTPHGSRIIADAWLQAAHLAAD